MMARRREESTPGLPTAAQRARFDALVDAIPKDADHKHPTVTAVLDFWFSLPSQRTIKAAPVHGGYVVGVSVGQLIVDMRQFIHAPRVPPVPGPSQGLCEHPPIAVREGAPATCLACDPRLVLVELPPDVAKTCEDARREHWPAVREEKQEDS